MCASERLLYPLGSNYLFLDAFLAPPFLAPPFLAPPAFFAAFFAPFLVAISLVAPFFQFLFFRVRPQDTVVTCLLWARVNGAQHLAI